LIRRISQHQALSESNCGRCHTLSFAVANVGPIPSTKSSRFVILSEFDVYRPSRSSRRYLTFNRRYEESRPKTQRWNSGRDCKGRNLTYHRHVFTLRQPSEAKDTHHCWRRLRRARRPCLALRHGHLPLSQKAATHRVRKHAGFHGPQSSRALRGAPRSSSHGGLASTRTLP
jgi:hypothetical protein